MTSRRRFMLGSLAALGGLGVGWALMPPRQRLMPRAPLSLEPGQVAFNGWVAIDGQGQVTVFMPRTEMGQGIHTGLAMLLAEELDADWSRVRVANTPIDPIYNNIATVVDGLPFHPDDDGSLKRVAGWMVAKLMREMGVMMTGGSSSIKDLWLPMRQAGASARAMLVQAAAERWQLPAAEISVSQGVVRHSSGRTATFGELAAQAGQRPLVAHPSLKPASSFQLIGQPVHRLDSAAKSNGRAVFGTDIAESGMRCAAVRMCPVPGGKAGSIDSAAAQKAPGVRAVFILPGFHGGTGGVAVIADTWWQARRALDQVQVTWDTGDASLLSTADIDRQLQAALEGTTGHDFHRRGNADAALASSARRVIADYRAPYLAHAPLEPMNCTVQVNAGRATVWVPTQVPDLARRAVASVTGIASEHIDIRVVSPGGGFGRRLDVDFIAQAAAIALRGEGRPVKTLWSREEDMTHDFYRPACVARLEAGLDAQGRVLAWRHRTASQALVPAYAHRVLGLKAPGPDKTTSEGAFDQAYEFEHARISHAAIELPVPVGFWRSVGHSHQAFFKESFLDEVAAAAGQDPVACRAALLQRHPRHLAVLRRVASLSRWGEALPPVDGMRRGRGLALHQSFGAIVAQVADVSVDARGRIRVDRVFCVIDCGLAVNPGLVRQQVDSAIVFGLSAALQGEITIAQGQVQQTNFHDYPMMRMADCPVIDTEIIASGEPPEGVGEPPLPPIAPAVGNAVFAATGQRLRSLPLRLA